MSTWWRERCSVGTPNWPVKTDASTGALGPRWEGLRTRTEHSSTHCFIWPPFLLLWSKRKCFFRDCSFLELICTSGLQAIFDLRLGEKENKTETENSPLLLAKILAFSAPWSWKKNTETEFGGNRKVALILSSRRGEHSRLLPQEQCPHLWGV